MKCPKCGSSVSTEDNFCNNCGERLEKEEEKPFIGSTINQGIFRITFAPIEEEFDDKFQAEEAVRHSSWNDGEGELEVAEIKLIKKTATKKTHPFICDSCHRVVAKNRDGLCMDCGEENWIERN